jgi:hypothetical protein
MYLQSLGTAIWNCAKEVARQPRGRPKRRAIGDCVAMSLGLFGRAAGMQAPRLLGAWFDSERSGWAVWILLALFVVVWTAFHIISNAALDLHDDITEIYTWSRTLRPGYYKHPPLGALMAAPWFVLFPAADWSFRLFAMLNAALALFAVDLIARRFSPATSDCWHCCCCCCC